MMHSLSTPRTQRGAVLVIGLIVLMLITLMVTAAFKFSTSNLKAVGNMQTRNEAIASANRALERVIANWDFNTAPNAHYIEVDIDNDGPVDYIVRVAKPICIKAAANRKDGDKGSECIINLNGTASCTSSTGAPSDFSAVWELDATATGAHSGTTVRVRQGVSRPLSQNQCNTLCPPAPGVACS